MPGLEHLSQTERVGAVHLGKEKAPGRSQSTLQRGLTRRLEGLLTRARSDSSTGKGLKLHEGRFILDLSKKLFTARH